MKLKISYCLPLGVFLALSLFFWRGLSLNPQHLPSSLIGHPLPVFNLPILGEDNSQHFTPNALRGHVSVLVVWASWCDACKQEQIFLFELARQGVMLYGLNYKDDPQTALDWLNDWGNPYRLIGQDRQGRVAMDLGVYGAPETYLIDANGYIRYRHPGILTASIWHKEFLPRMSVL